MNARQIIREYSDRPGQRDYHLRQAGYLCWKCGKLLAAGATCPNEEK